jgi:hypothetical protein
VCQRCQRLERECIYKEHRRGRFSDSKKVQQLEETIQRLLSELQEAKSPTQHATSSSSGASSSRHQDGSTPATGIYSKRSNAQNPARMEQVPPKDDFDLPILSEPLELLAHASYQVRDDQQGAAESAQFLPVSSRSRGLVTSGPARGKAFFSSGLCDIKSDHFDPIDKGIVSQWQAHQLFNVFIKHLNESLRLLDPHLHTFEYVRHNSSMLLTSIMWLASLFDPSTGPLGVLLDKHLKDTIFPAIHMGTYRSVEICQAFLLLAYYHPPTQTLSDDKSWQYIGQAARIASELGMNRQSKLSPQRKKDEPFMRRVRNRDR